MKKQPVQWLMYRLIHLAAILPLVILIIDFATGNLTINPIQEATQRTGRYAIWLLIASLACTPLNTILNIPWIIKLRKSLGLYAFGYAFLHAFIYIVVDYGLDVAQLVRNIVEKRFLLAGVPGFFILAILAATSFRSIQRKMGKAWKYFHRLVYLAAILTVVHFAWAAKGNLAFLQGNILQPAILAGLLVVFFILRLPLVRRWIAARRSHS